MPKAAFKLAAVDSEIALDDIASHIMNVVSDWKQS
jgi:chemotaxis response regulator CheB